MDEFYFIAVVPREPQFTRMRHLMEECSATLGSKDALQFPPHITVVPRFMTVDYGRFEAALATYAASMPRFDVVLTACERFEDNRILKLSVESPALHKIHTHILALVQEHRTPWVREALVQKAKTAHDRELAQAYGSPYVLDQYRPHLTLAGPDVNARFSSFIPEIELPLVLAIDAIAILRKREHWEIVALLPLRQL